MNIAFIPARCGSKSIPFKNIKDFCGKPLIFWVLSELQNSNLIDEIYVATDCNKIESVVLNFNFSKVRIYRREKRNAQDNSSTEDVILEFLRKYNFKNDDFFILVQATSPFTRSKDFEKAIKQLKKEKKDSLLSCVRIKRFFWTKNGKPINYNYLNRPRRQDFEGTFVENGAFYINKIGNILKNKNRLSGLISIYEMPSYTYIELDEKDDWIIAENIMRKYILIKNKLKIKLFLSDVDGTLTDGGMYYGNNGEEFKKFNTIDGKGFELLKKYGIKIGFITSEKTKIVENRAKKLKIDYLYQGLKNKNKLKAIKEICNKENISLNEVAFIGDDINDKEALENVGLAACPSNAVFEIKNIPNIIKLKDKGGDGAVREFIDYLLKNSLFYFK